MIGILHVLKYLMPLCCPIQKCTVGPPENELDIIYTPLIEELKLHNGKKSDQECHNSDGGREVLMHGFHFSQA